MTHPTLSLDRSSSLVFRRHDHHAPSAPNPLSTSMWPRHRIASRRLLPSNFPRQPHRSQACQPPPCHRARTEPLRSSGVPEDSTPADFCWHQPLNCVSSMPTLTLDRSRFSGYQLSACDCLVMDLLVRYSFSWRSIDQRGVQALTSSTRDSFSANVPSAWSIDPTRVGTNWPLAEPAPVPMRPPSAISG